jgi:hypothetical protein
MAVAPEPRKPAGFIETNQIENHPESKPRAILDSTGQTIREVGSKTTESIAPQPEFSTETVKRISQQSQEAAASGFRAIMGVQVPLADVGLEQGRRMIDATAQVTDVYREAAERSADDVQALVSSMQTFGRGLQQWQRAFLDLMNQSAERISRKRGDLMSARSPVQVAEVHRDLYLDAVQGLFAANTTLLQLGVQIAQDTMRPLQDRARVQAKT